MGEQLTAGFFAANRRKLRELFTGTAPIILTANGLLQRNADATFPFRQDSSFWYFTGINEPDVILVLDKAKEYLIVPFREGSRAAFDGNIDEESLRVVSGIETIYGLDEGWKQLGSRLKKAKHFASLAPLPTYIEAHGFYPNPARARLIEAVTAYNPSLELLDLRMHITRLRMVKQPEELQQIQAAIDLTGKTLASLVKKGVEKFAYEYEVEAYITGKFRKSNSHHAYTPIVASGANACTLHYVGNHAKIEPNQLLLLDVGAEISNYAADITRTYIVGKASKRQMQVYEAVLAVQNFALELLKPGVVIKEYESKVEQFMGEKLRELGLIKKVEHDDVRKYYPHATSHFLGLDVHDVGEYDQPLPAGVVLTVEPGVYIPEEGIGIRIEDNVLITENGYEILSAKLPRVLS